MSRRGLAYLRQKLRVKNSRPTGLRGRGSGARSRVEPPSGERLSDQESSQPLDGEEGLPRDDK